MRWNSDGVSTPSPPKLLQNASPSSLGNESNTVSFLRGASLIVRWDPHNLCSIGVQIFDSRAGIENHDAFRGRDPFVATQQFQSCETRSAFRTDEETFLRSDLAPDANHFSVVDSNRAAVRFTKNIEDQKIADGFWNAQAGGYGARIWKFCGDSFSGFECANNGRATGSLHGEHARPFVRDPAKRL